MNFLVDIAPTVIYFPETTQEKEILAEKFRKVCYFRNALFHNNNNNM